MSDDREFIFSLTAKIVRLEAALAGLLDAMISHSPADRADRFGCRRICCDVWDENDAKALEDARAALGTRQADSE